MVESGSLETVPFPENSGSFSPPPLFPFFLHVLGERRAGNLRSLRWSVLGPSSLGRTRMEMTKRPHFHILSCLILTAHSFPGEMLESVLKWWGGLSKTVPQQEEAPQLRGQLSVPSLCLATEFHSLL